MVLYTPKDTHYIKFLIFFATARMTYDHMMN